MAFAITSQPQLTDRIGHVVENFPRFIFVRIALRPAEEGLKIICWFGDFSMVLRTIPKKVR